VKTPVGGRIGWLGPDARNGGQRTVFDAGLIRSSQDPTTRPGYDVVKRAMDLEFKR
jgi:hypothetical protein